MRTNYLLRLCVSLLVVLIPWLVDAHDFVVDGIHYEIISEVKRSVSVTYDGNAYPYSSPYYNKIVIPSTVEYNKITYDVIGIGDSAFYRGDGITSITIPESIMAIGEYAFGDIEESSVDIYVSSIESYLSIKHEGITSCPGYGWNNVNLYIADELATIIEIPFFVSSIQSGLFCNHGKISSIKIPEGVVELGENAFAGCQGLTSVTIPESVESIKDEAFAGCIRLKDIYCLSCISPNISYATFGEWGEGNYTGNNIGRGKLLHVPKDATGYSEGYWRDILCNPDMCGFELSELPIIKYVVDDKVLYTCAVKFGDLIPVLPIPTKEGYTFSGWNEIPETMPAEDVIISGIFAINKYLVTFKIGDEVIASDSLEYGTAIIAPEVPNKTGYTFDGWGEIPEVVPANDVTIEGSYSVDSYSLTYVMDGEVYCQQTITYGATIEAIAVPTKEGHTFNGWSGLPETMPAKDITVSATFTVNKYQVTFKIDGVVIANYTQDYGSVIVAPDAPEREGHTFSGWGDVAETVPASDVTYEGSYSVNSYTITYSVDGEVVHSESVNYGAAIIAPEEPTKEGHTFSGWSEVPETMPAEDVTVSGTFIINKYLVTFKIGDEVIASDSLEYGATIVAPEVPEKEGHTFNGWGEVAETVPASDVTYEGMYTVNIYKVYYYVDEELVHTAEVAYGEPIPEYIYEPAEEGYTFLGWIGETYATMPAHDVTYTANIDNGIGTLTIDCSQLNIYDLTGRKVADTLKGGIYIINGKKVVIND